ncbi:MAG: PAS domain S-box protein [Mariprofundaceae bacterium]
MVRYLKIAPFCHDWKLEPALVGVLAQHEIVKSVEEADLCILDAADVDTYLPTSCEAWHVVIVDADDAAAYAMRLGAHDYMVKPVTEMKLQRVLQQAWKWLQQNEKIRCIQSEDHHFRQRAETALWRSEEKYLNLFRYTNDAIFIMNAKSRKVVDCNHRVLALTGYSRKEMMGLDIAALNPPDIAKKNSKIMQTIIRQGSGTLEHLLLHKDGRQTPVAIHANEIFFDGARAFQFMVRDIGDQKRAEEALRKSEWRLRSILNHAPVAICLKDLQGRYLLANERYETLFNFNNSPCVGKSDDDLFPQELVGAFRSHEQKVVERRESLAFEEKVVLGGKTQVFHSLKFPLDDEEGHIYAVCGMLTDITERKHAIKAIQRLNQENQSLAQASLQAREKERTLIARELHDELGQTLTMIRNELHRLAEQSKGRVKSMDSVQYLDAAIENMIAITRSLLQRLQPPLLKDVSLCDALMAQVRDWENHQRNVHCTFNASKSINSVCQDIKLIIYRVIQEALTNISKHAEASMVTVSIKADAKSKLLCLSIDDDGKGMDLTNMAHHGLGLIGMRERLAAVGGQFNIKSYPGGGTTLIAEIML